MVSLDARSSVLITGCGGYIGSRLARALRERDVAVRGLDRAARGLQPLAPLGVETIVADVSDQATLRAAARGVTVVYHLAGSALGERATLVQNSLAAARAVAAVCGPNSGVQALVFASSGALYPSGTQWLSEITPPEPAFAYAQAKLAAEQVLLEAHAAAGIPVLIARIAGVYGPHNPALMIEQVRRGRFPLIGGGYGYASYLHIDDLIAALLALPARGTPGQVYNLADDEPVRIREFYGRLAQLLAAPAPPALAPGYARLLVGAINSVARLLGRAPPLPADMVEMAAVSHRMANRRMRTELGIELRYPTYRTGLVTCIPERTPL